MAKKLHTAKESTLTGNPCRV